MKKRELLKKTEKIVNGNSCDVFEIDKCGEELTEFVFRKNFNHVLVFSVFLFLAFILFNRANKLSFIDLDFYILFVSVCIGLGFVSAIVFFTLYIYNKRKSVVYTRKMVESRYKYFQFYDLISFIGIVITIMLWFVMFIATPIEVTGTSMETNYYEKDKILVWHLFYETEKDDVVIVDVSQKYSFNEETEFVIKRVVALSGDKVRYDALKGYVYVNDQLVCVNVTIDQFETMLTFKSDNSKYFNGLEGVVPNGYAIVLGDNREVSMDSRSVGLILEEDILGVCFFRIYPFNNFGLVK